ncbi:MAG: hypothetical protein UR93_C0007G0005 [Berkelbacteria bacterium GW2011_GWA2_35_9]|uniref:HTH cro/C1-type domain-containing protein n=1 Tax=Berkelbacteria bacterium GW2011_GWA2_35_9 TaxID=1618333 RepID=A0A0G0D6C6_9BACT|nr:MAG: hypothetical protein UR93_C0007G0005 [Berkelbacteria bacterium GW2011_GWA2_35_9]
MFKTKVILTNSNLGKLLHSTRSKKKLSLSDIEEKTNIRKKYLIALENGDFSVFPGKVYALGFCKKYCEVLGLEYNRVNRIFESEFALKEDEEVFFREKIGTAFFSVTPKTFLIALGILAGLLLLGYFYYQISLISAPPKLEITSPLSEITTDEYKINITGETDVDANLKIDDQAINFDSSGKFTQEISLKAGLNSIEIVATNRFDKKTTKNIKVLKKENTETTTTTTTI